MVLRLLLLVCLLAGNAHAGWIDKQGNPLPDSDDRKSVGAFGAQLIFTVNEQALFKKWATPSETVDVDAVESVSINQPISAFVIFSGCKPDATNLCKVSMRFRVIQPDGKVYSETPAMEVWHGKPAPPGRSLELSVQYLKVIVEPHELRGRYTVQTQVRDDNTDTVLFLQKTFTAVDSSAKKHNPALQGTLPAWAEKVVYELYSLDANGNPTLLAKGSKEYSDSDIRIERLEYQGEVHWSKSLSLEKGFGIGASIYQEPEITGFGIWAEGSPCGFSWEWFNVTGAGKFKKLQESGEVSVVHREVGQNKEIAEIHFDTDISLRLNESKEVGKKTHRILVRRGSVLKFPPNNALHGTVALTRPCP